MLHQALLKQKDTAKYMGVNMIPENFVLLFTSFWFSIFFFSLSLANSIFCFDCIEGLDVFLITLLCILCSHELARKLTLHLVEENKKQEK